MGRKKNDALAAMAEAKAQPSPDFTAADDSPEADGRAPQLPEPCPVTPLGILGKQLVFLDRFQQLVMAPTKCDKGDLMLWFGTRYLELHFGQEGKERWDQRKVQTALVEDCGAFNIFSPQDRVFGRGAHRGPNGGHELVLHLGGQVLVIDHSQRATKHKVRPVKAGAVQIGGERTYYPAAASLPPPAPKAATREDALMLEKTFSQFFFVEPDAAPLLLVGMTAQMFICGALPWRSHMWLTAPTGSGKTTLQSIIREMMGSWCLYTEDASEAAIRQTLRDDTLPVMIDEAEAHDNPAQKAALLNLMKKASAGGKIYRGSSDHTAKEFTAQSSFLLSSVLHAPLRGEDRNRMAILEMRSIPQGSPPLELELAMWRTKGRAFQRRMIEHWDRWEKTYSAYKRAIAAVGYDGRWQDTFGTLLTCADLLLYDTGINDITPLDEPGEERVARAVSVCLPMMERGRSEARSDVERVILHLTTSMLPGAHGKPSEPVGIWIDRAMTLCAKPMDDPSGSFPTDPMEIDQAARDKLTAHGLRVVRLTENERGGQPKVSDAPADAWDSAYLAIAYQTNQPLKQIFAHSDWAGGTWVQSFGKIKDVQKAKVRFSGNLDNAICVPLRAFRPADEE